MDWVNLSPQGELKTGYTTHTYTKKACEGDTAKTLL